MYTDDSTWEFWIDRGGTFTDIIGRRGRGPLLTHKLLSEDPARYADAAAAGIRVLMDRYGEGPIAALKMGTTIATNALLERKGALTVLAVTSGHGDALRIGYQARPKLFARHIVVPEPVYAHVVEIEERVSADGAVLRPLDENRTRRALEEAFTKGFRSLAIVLLHGYRYHAHERRVAEIAREIGFTQISTSHETGPVIKFVTRGDTAVADAYLSPLLRAYVDGLRGQVGRRTRLFFMQSSGGLVEADAFGGKDAVLSGPAGGVIGMASVARAAGCVPAIG